MKVGTFYFPTDYGIDVSELAPALEQRGFESLFVCEHTHIPVSRRTPFPGGGELPKRYKHTHDPFVALSFAAAATKTLTSCRAAVSSSPWAAAGTSTRWRTTAPSTSRASSCCASAHWR
jgi:alkanesulfonate monooxygenase SsuD/methylene tetrahydromethanopterin reductase-like flavin-dependent oxidoreductase (luciferase family)